MERLALEEKLARVCDNIITDTAGISKPTPIAPTSPWSKPDWMWTQSTTTIVLLLRYNKQ